MGSSQHQGATRCCGQELVRHMQAPTSSLRLPSDIRERPAPLLAERSPLGPARARASSSSSSWRSGWVGQGQERRSVGSGTW